METKLTLKIINLERYSKREHVIFIGIKDSISRLMTVKNTKNMNDLIYKTLEERQLIHLQQIAALLMMGLI